MRPDIQFKLALFTLVCAWSFAVTLSADLVVHPVKPAAQEIVLRVQITPPQLAI